MRKESFHRAMKTVHERHDAAEAAAEQRRLEIALKIPEITVLTNRLTQTCTQITRAVFSKEENAQKAIERLMQENLSAQEKIKQLLAQNGYPADYLFAAYTCAACSDTGYIDGAQCKCLKELIVHYEIESFNAQNQISAVTFSQFDLSYYNGDARTQMERVFAFCQQYADQFSRNAVSILMQGGVGLGKAHLSLSIASALMEKGYAVLYLSAPDLFRKLQNEYYGKSETKTDTMDLIRAADLVIIDDLGAELENQFNSMAFYNIVNLRQNIMRPMIINTNLSFKEIEQRYSQRMMSRLLSFRCLKFAGTDIRQIKMRLQYGAAMGS